MSLELQLFVVKTFELRVILFEVALRPVVDCEEPREVTLCAQSRLNGIEVDLGFSRVARILVPVLEIELKRAVLGLLHQLRTLVVLGDACCEGETRCFIVNVGVDVVSFLRHHLLQIEIL